MVFSEHMAQDELLELIENDPAGDPTGFPAANAGRNTDENFVDKILGDQRPVDRRSAFGQHHLGPEISHSMERFREIDDNAATLQNVCVFSYLTPVTLDGPASTSKSTAVTLVNAGLL